MKVWLLSWGGEGMPEQNLVYNKKPSFEQFLEGLRSFRSESNPKEQAFSDTYHLDYESNWRAYENGKRITFNSKEEKLAHWKKTYESKGYIDLGDYEGAGVCEIEVIKAT